MSRPEPSLGDLLEVARTVLRDEVAPELSGGARYKALMAANAMAIVARQIAAGEDNADKVASAEIVRRLRVGEIGEDDGRALHGQILDNVIARVRESNPRALAAHGLD